MLQKDQLEQQLKSEAKSALFDKQFAEAVSKHLQKKREEVSKPYSEKVDWQKYQLQKRQPL